MFLGAAFQELGFITNLILVREFNERLGVEAITVAEPRDFWRTGRTRSIGRPAAALGLGSPGRLVDLHDAALETDPRCQLGGILTRGIGAL
jgi:hypothetical protein